MAKPVASRASRSTLGSVILTGEGLFTKSQLTERIDSDQALTLVFEISQHIARMYEVRDEYVETQNDAASSFDRTIRKDRSVILPTVANVPARCKELLQKADHVQRDLLKLVSLFYGKRERGWEGLRSKIDGEPRIDQFAEFLADYVPFILTVRHARNAAEHPNDVMGVDVQDFSVDASRALHPPMIEVRHHKTPVPRMPVEHFMSQVCEGFVSTVEMLMVFLCARHIRQEGAMPVQVMVLPEEQRRSGVRFCYGVMIGGQLVPMS